MGVGSALRKIVTIVATILVAIIGIVIIRLVHTELSDIEYSPGNVTDVVDGDFGAVAQEKACLLDANRDDDEDSLCLLAYAGVAVTFAVMFTLSILLCLTCNLCGAGFIVDAVANALLCAGWVMYSSWVTDAVREIDEWDPQPNWESDDAEQARLRVVLLSWAQAVLTALVAIITLSSGCCCSDNSK
eukprot:jgi/Ulvmu1/2919/UM148_0003.1